MNFKISSLFNMQEKNKKWQKFSFLIFYFLYTAHSFILWLNFANRISNELRN